MKYALGEKVDRTSVLWGIDASAYQPVIDFDTLHAQGCSFAILKAVQGVGGIDACFDQHLKRYCAYVDLCASEGNAPMRLGLYAFVIPDADPGDAEAEAESVLRIYRKMRNAVSEAVATAKQKYPGKRSAFLDVDLLLLPVALDLEVWPPKLVGEALRKWLGTYVSIVERATGSSVLNYTNGSYLQSARAGSDFLNGRPLWIACYDRGFDPKTPMTPSEKKLDFPSVPRGQYGWWFWQPDAYGVDGVTDSMGRIVRCDINFFNGETQADLDAFLRLQRIEVL